MMTSFGGFSVGPVLPIVINGAILDRRRFGFQGDEPLEGVSLPRTKGAALECQCRP